MTKPDKVTVLSTAYVLNYQMAKRDILWTSSSICCTLRIFSLQVDICHIHVNIFLFFPQDVYTNDWHSVKTYFEGIVEQLLNKTHN